MFAAHQCRLSEKVQGCVPVATVPLVSAIVSVWWEEMGSVSLRIHAHDTGNAPSRRSFVLLFRWQGWRQSCTFVGRTGRGGSPFGMGCAGQRCLSHSRGRTHAQAQSHLRQSKETARLRDGRREHLLPVAHFASLAKRPMAHCEGSELTARPRPLGPARTISVPGPRAPPLHLLHSLQSLAGPCCGPQACLS